MHPVASEVNRRPYDGSARQERARARHAATLDAAERLFLSGGYLAIAIARAAG